MRASGGSGILRGSNPRSPNVRKSPGLAPLRWPDLAPPGGGAAEAIGIGSGFDDVGAVGDPVEQRLAQPGIGEDLGPLRERQVGGDDDRRPLGPFGDHLEQELRARVGQGHVADLIERDEIVLEVASGISDETQIAALTQLGCDCVLGMAIYTGKLDLARLRALR